MINENGILRKVENEDIVNDTFNIPEDVITLGYNAFSECKNLKSVHIPDSVTTIGDYAFAGCTNLTNINIPNSVTYIGHNAFWGCPNLIKKGKYMICNIFADKNNITYSWNNKEFKIGEQMPVIDDIKCHERGYHYVENLYEVFNYYSGDLNDVTLYAGEISLFGDEIALLEIEPGKIIEKVHENRGNICVTNSIKLVRCVPWNEAFGN